jgi:type VI secretion system protein ImpA
MILREDIYQAISDEHPTGEDLRYAPVYEKIREARRQDEDLEQGVWKHERKIADFGLVIKLAQEALATKSKDLQLAAWLTEALLIREGFGGLESGLNCSLELIRRYGRDLYPASDDDGLETLAVPLEWLGARLDVPIRSTGLNVAGHNWFQFRDSRSVGYEEQAKEPSQKKAREKALKEGKLAPEAFDKAFAETEKSFYVANEQALDHAIVALTKLSEACAALLGEAAPGFSRVFSALEEVRHLVHQLLEKKRETEPDPVKPTAWMRTEDEPAALQEANQQEPNREVALGDNVVPSDWRTATQNIAAAAAFLRKKEPFNPASYLMLRGLRWGELRHAASAGDPTKLEAPPTEARRRIKLLALEEQWDELIEAAESLMAQPCSRAWLDLQRLVVEACVALGPQFDAVAKAIRSEVRALVSDVPQLLTAMLMDDSPAANNETQAWLRELLTEQTVPVLTPAGSDERANEPFRRKFTDVFAQATAASKGGAHEKAFELMRDEVSRQRSGRGRFVRRLQLVKLCVSANKEAIAQPILEDLIAALEAHKLEDWEERDTVVDALGTIMSASKRIQSDAKEKQKYFDRICRLDPVKALTTG